MQANIGVTVLLRNQCRNNLIGGGWFSVTEIRRAEQTDRSPRIRLNQPPCAVQFQPRTLGRNQCQIGMCETMIADLAAFIHNPVEQEGVWHGIFTNNEEGRGHMLGL